jgi:hypothetical protein
MKGDRYTIVKGYKVYKGGDANGEPIAEFTEPQLYDWLRTTGGYLAGEAANIIVRTDVTGLTVIVLP